MPRRLTGKLAFQRWLLMACLGSFLLAFSPVCATAEPLPVHHRILPTGQHVYVVEKHDQPIVTVDTWVATGSVNETQQTSGLSHFLEHLLFKGTPTRPTGAIERWLDSKGAVYNAATSKDFTHYYVTIASPFYKEALALQADMLLRSTVPPDELERERLVVVEEINRSENLPMHRLFDTLTETLFAGHPYAQSTLGPRQVIRTVPRDTIVDYWKSRYQPHQLHTVVVGDVQTEEAVAAVARAFQPNSTSASDTKRHLPSGRKNKSKTSSSSPMALDAIANAPFPSGPQVKVLTDPAIRQGYGIIALPAPAAPNWQDSIALDAAFDVLGGGPASRLVQLLRNEKKLVTSVSAGNMTQRYGGVLYILFQAPPEHFPEITRLVRQELARLKQAGVTETELSRVKQSTTKTFLFENEQTDNVAMAVGYNVALGQLTDYTLYLNRLTALQSETVQQTAQSWVDLNRLAVIALVPQQASDALKTALHTEVSRPVGGTETGVTQPSPPSATARVQSQRLANGVLWIQNPLPSAQTVSLHLFAPGGLRCEDKPGTALMMARLLGNQTRYRNEAELNRWLEANGIALSVAADEDAWVLTAQATAADAGELLGIVDEVLANPVWDVTMFEREKRLLAQALQAQLDEPVASAMDTAKAALFTEHPYGHTATRILEALPSLTLADVQQYFAQTFRPFQLVAVSSGPLEGASVQAVLATLSSAPDGALQQRQSSRGQDVTCVTHTHYKPLKQGQVLPVRKPGQSATWLVRAWPAPPYAHADTPALKVLSTVLGGGMSSRLFVELREKQGLAYSVGSSFPATRQSGGFYLFIGTDPANEAKVQAEFDAQVQTLQTTLLSAQALQAAKDQIIGKFALAHETPAAQGQYLGLYEMLGMGYAYDQHFAQDIARVTAEDVQRVAQHYLGVPSITALVGPTSSKTSEPPAQK